MGRRKNIESPEKMWEYFCSYRQWVIDNPIKKIVKGNKNFVVSDESLKRPLTIEGFEIWLYENGIIADIADYLKNKEGRYADFAPICLLIRKVVRADQIEGGMVGIYSASITQRLNGLVEKAQTDNTLTIKMDGGDDIST